MEMPRWTIAELLTRYELEPSLTDVFVEGQFDKDILMCAYDHAPNEKRAMYTADVLDIPHDMFEKHSLTKGNKQKLIILCRELSNVNEHENVRFIVDRDTDHWFGDLEIGKGLLWTEFCDIETYFFEEDFVKELVVNAGKAKIDKWNVFYESFHNALKALFAVRAAAREAGLSLDYMDFEKYVSIGDGRLCFDLDTYIQRTLHKSKLFEHNEKMLEAIREWCQRFNGDPRLFCRGHDFVVLIAWAIMKFRGAKSLSNEVICRILVLLVPRDAGRFASLL
ncbi:hypothetical protein [Rhizobium leguminosarum]|uniref:hypothetical protein n=1 Tax=Rhizobium leguminosarum TaxID=384 RepID=UPI003F9D0EB5